MMKGLVVRSILLTAVGLVVVSGVARAEPVTICHVPPGSPADAHLLDVGPDAVAPHLDHGDFVANLDTPCRTTPPELRDFIETTMVQSHYPGLAACVVHNGVLVWCDAFGWRNMELEPWAPVTFDTPFRVASLSKTFVATALMQLEQEGLFSLDDDIDVALQGLADPFEIRNPYHPDEPITYRQLFTHTSSIRRARGVDTGDLSITLAYLVRETLSEDAPQRLKNFWQWAPGEAWAYSNHGATTLGYLLEAITGGDLADYCQANVFEPLQMDDTFVYFDGRDEDRFAMLYKWSPSDETYVPLGHTREASYPAGSFRSSAHDLARFLAAYANGGCIDDCEEPVLAPQTIARMWTPQAYTSTGAVIINGFGLLQGLIWMGGPLEGRMWFGHGGSVSGSVSTMRVRADDGLGFVVMANGSGTAGIDDIVALLHVIAEEWLPEEE